MWQRPLAIAGGSVAAVACLHPRLLLMDEPFASLDEVTRHRLQNDLLDLWRAEGQTLLFVTHSLEEAVFLADRIVVMAFAGIAADRRVDWPRPRDRFSPSFVELMADIRKSLCPSPDEPPAYGSSLPPVDEVPMAEIRNSNSGIQDKRQ